MNIHLYVYIMNACKLRSHFPYLGMTRIINTYLETAKVCLGGNEEPEERV
jgi:hypothetical protein